MDNYHRTAHPQRMEEVEKANQQMQERIDRVLDESLENFLPGIPVSMHPTRPEMQRKPAGDETLEMENEARLEMGMEREPMPEPSPAPVHPSQIQIQQQGTEVGKRRWNVHQVR
jgi:hypothetical protein